jgi:aldose 1-epimerase
VPDLELRAGDVSAEIDSRGGGIRALRVGDWDVIDGYESGAKPSGCRGQILAPWPNRLYQGRYHWQGAEYVVAVNDAASDSAIHGLVNTVEWQTEKHTERTAELSVLVPRSSGYPFEVRVRVHYELDDGGLRVALGAVNEGARAAPFGIGMHPYFRCGADADDTTVTVPVRSRLLLGPDWRPTTAEASFDGHLGRLGDRVLDDATRCADPPDRAPVQLDGPAGSLRIELGNTFGWLQLFTGDTLPSPERRRSIAIEPMTCPPHAFATSTDVITLEPGGSWADQWSLRWSPARHRPAG